MKQFPIQPRDSETQRRDGMGR